MSEPRRHHFVPASYLGGFSSATGLLAVIGMHGKRWEATPASIAFERDLYRLEGVEGIDPNDFEKGFASLEGQFVTVLRDISDSAHLPDTSSEEFAVLIEYLALMMVRSPELRNRVTADVRELAETVDREMTSSPERFAATLEQAKSQGLDVPEDPELIEKIRRLPLGERFTIHVPNAFFMRALFSGLDMVRSALAARNWTLYCADAAGFVTSDRPVAVTLSELGMESERRADFRDPDSDITFPLNQNYFLFGSSQRCASRSTLNASRREVASLNSRTISMANRFVCWSGGELLWMTAARTLADADQFFKAVCDRSRGLGSRD